MEHSVNLQDLVKHIVNGTLEHNICLICLMPLRDGYQNIHSRICKDGKTYSIADALNQVCNVKISNVDEYRICSNCFVCATQAYKFYLTSRRSQQVVNFYVNEINNQLQSNILQDFTSDSLCITLPIISLSNIETTINSSLLNSFQTKSEIYNLGKSNTVKKDEKQIDVKWEDDLVMLLNENGAPEFYRPQKDGSLILIDNKSVKLKDYLKKFPESKELNLLSSHSNKLDSNLTDSNVKKKRGRKRNPMEYKCCSKCPVRYRFVSKLKEHMKEEHGIDLFVCQVCQAIIEDESEFTKHLQSHTGIHTCATCNMVFKKRDTIIAHFKWHEEVKAIAESDGAHVCEVCGLFFKDEEYLKEHHDKKHVKKFTCYYCGRMYKGEISFDLHIKKHEMNNDVRQNASKRKCTPAARARAHTCAACGKHFVDERALLWHERLHTNERPYVCDVCGRGFVSLNRRNQHAVCAHTAPARRCPLCPALFHLRSMVNTHIKKVHLKAHKRPTRTSKHQNVFWKTETVPIQELSVSIQNDILELQAAQTEAKQTKW
ncbi:zinc finger protein 121 [Bicyclus anynana]|uniref:Zinc finger protein 121 n=1 Tax=Bicyclus anynana TaxID=110368 RepID=A0A6J1P9L6_BICAN|nr:zinc finger protein 121 [Bicyclus anynana]